MAKNPYNQKARLGLPQDFRTFMRQVLDPIPGLKLDFKIVRQTVITMTPMRGRER